MGGTRPGFEMGSFALDWSAAERVTHLYQLGSDLVGVEESVQRFYLWLSEYVDFEFLLFSTSNHSVVLRSPDAADSYPPTVEAVISAFENGAWLAPQFRDGRGGFRFHRRTLVVADDSVSIAVCRKAGTQRVSLDALLDQSVGPFLDMLGRAFQYERLLDQANRDPLTGLPNRRAFDARLASTLDEANRYGHSFSVAAFDLDGFKSINDGYGHPAGDEALRSTARVMAKGLRISDFLARIGGDEFAAILPSTDPSGARNVVQRVRLAVSALQIPTSEGVLTASAGIAGWRSGVSAEDIYGDADRGLYQSKASRRYLNAH
jgi:diguanylate cyclase (GGDEF)-like protein